MKLYDAMTPNSLRVKVFISEKGIDVPRIKIDVMGGGTRTADFLAKNSLGELPLLELDDGRHLSESVAICRYLESLHPEPSLMGANAEEQAFIEMWSRRVEQQLFDVIGGIGRHSLEFFADKLEQIPEYAAAQKRELEKKWAWFDEEMSDGRTFVVNDKFSIADITGMAILFVSDFMDLPMPNDLKHAKRWQAALRARPSYVSVFAESAAA